MRRAYILGLLAVLILTIAAGCQKAAEQVEPVATEPEVIEPEVTEPVVTEPAVPAGADVQVLRAGFDPETVTIAVGSTVTWKNMDDRTHLVVIDNQDRSPSLEQGDTWDKTFEQAGTYEMTDVVFKYSGTVVVK